MDNEVYINDSVLSVDTSVQTERVPLVDLEKVRITLYSFTKRLFDIIVSLLVLLVFFIPMIFIAIAIKLESKGPVFFKQKRTGKNGKEFNLYKFRSMTVDNDVLDFKCENKVTKVGKFIRKTSLDELGQIINILKGDMSWIGPRPWIVEYYQNFTESQKSRLKVLPGVTGLAQCSGRNDLTIFEKIDYDIQYVNSFSLITDLKIVFLTIKSLLKREAVEISKSGIREEIVLLKQHYLQTTNEIPVIVVNDDLVVDVNGQLV